MIIGNLSDFIDYDLFKKVEEQSKIFYKNNPRGRTFNQIFYDTFVGEACELAAANFYNGKQVPFNISYYDIETSNGEKIEVKHTRIISKYWNFNIDYYKHFLQNTNKIDKIILIELFPNGNLNLKFEMEANSFQNYIRKSQFNSNYYIAVDTAIKDGKLKVF